jgi:hypothetical protein
MIKEDAAGLHSCFIGPPQLGTNTNIPGPEYWYRLEAQTPVHFIFCISRITSSYFNLYPLERELPGNRDSLM